MLIKRIEGADVVFGPPPDHNKDSDTKIIGLPVKRIMTDEGLFFASAWEPTPAELMALCNGASVILLVRGPAHPVVKVCVDGVE